MREPVLTMREPVLTMREPVLTMREPVLTIERAPAWYRALLDAVDHWRYAPVEFVAEVMGRRLDPWQCDVLDALVCEDRVIVQASRGVGKTMTLAAALIWWLLTRGENARVVMTASMYNKQVRDAFWGQWVHALWRDVQAQSPWFAAEFDLHTTRLENRHRPGEWFAVGIAGSEGSKIEGYRSDHMLIILDEAKELPLSLWQSAQPVLSTPDSKLIAASTPGGLGGEFHRVIRELRSTWRSVFTVHPAPLRAFVPAQVPSVRCEHSRHQPPHARHLHRYSGTYYSTRVEDKLIEQLKIDWGQDSPVFTTQMLGLFPETIGDNLIPWSLLVAAEHRERGASAADLRSTWPLAFDGRVVACDVARFGRDRTVALVGEAGTLLHGESIARLPSEMTNAVERETFGVGDDPKRPEYRRTTATAMMLRRLRREYNAEMIVVDETGVGGGVDDILHLLRDEGEPVVGVNFGAAPTDRPRDADEAQRRMRLHLRDTDYGNFKAELARAVQRGFEQGQIALASLCAAAPCTPARCRPEVITRPLLAQTWQVQMRYDDIRHRFYVVDPDDRQDADPGMLEGRRSPDHFHALLLYWGAVTGKVKAPVPKAGRRLPDDVYVLSSRPVERQAQASTGAVGGQAAWVRRWYSR